MITLEDIEEEVFGEIYDEFETPAKAIEKVADDTWRIFGKTALKTINLELSLEIPEDENTVAGFLLAQMGKIPRAREKFSWGALEFIVERATARRIISVLLKIADDRDIVFYRYCFFLSDAGFFRGQRDRVYFCQPFAPAPSQRKRR